MTQSTPNRESVSVHHRVFIDSAPILLMAAGWAVLALLAGPWVRDSLAAAMIRGLTPSLRHLPHPPASLLAALAGAVLLAVVGLIWFLRSCVLQQPIPVGPPVPDSSLGMGGLPRLTAHRSVEGQIQWMRAARPRLVPDVRVTIAPNLMALALPDLGRTTLRIARNAYPSTRVRLDGRIIPWEPGPLGGILVDVPPGPHRMEIAGRVSRVRLQGRVAMIASVLVLLGVAFAPSKPSR